MCVCACVNKGCTCERACVCMKQSPPLPGLHHRCVCAHFKVTRCSVGDKERSGVVHTHRLGVATDIDHIFMHTHAPPHTPFAHTAPIIGHVGDGNFHCLLLVDPSNSQELQMAKDLGYRMGR